MDALSVELTAQIAENNGGISQSICIIQEVVKTWVLTQAALAKLNCRNVLTSQIERDKQNILSNIPTIPLIRSSVVSLESIIANPDSPEYLLRWGYILNFLYDNDLGILKATSKSLGRVWMARYLYDPEQYSLWKAIFSWNFTQLKEKEIKLEFELKQSNNWKAYFELKRLYLRKLTPPFWPSEVEEDMWVDDDVA